MKINLPTIVDEHVLLPFNELKIEVKESWLKQAIDEALTQDEALLFLVYKSNLISLKEQYGIVSLVEQKIELPNGDYKILLKGLKRAKVLKWKEDKKQYLNANVTYLPEVQLEETLNEALARKLKRELTFYIKTIPYVSNSILPILDSINNLSELTDVVSYFLTDNSEVLKTHINCCDAFERMRELLTFMYKEEEMFQIEKELDTKVRKQMDINQREYVLREKLKVIQEDLGNVDFKQKEIQKLNDKIKNVNIPSLIKERLNQELKRYESLTPSSPEQNVVLDYMENLLSLPWNQYKIENDDLLDVASNLKNTHYGLDEAKERIIEYLAVKKLTNRLTAPILCLVGPPGVGKTSFAESLATSMHRDFVKMSAGGMNDVSELVGHRKTYLGSSPGRIIQGLQRTKSMNPVFLIDEIDKLTKNYKGDPASTLLEILDPIQNKHFSDHYIEEEVDLSNVFFITTANSLETIPKALLDRLEIIYFSGYTELEKIDIAKKYLIPKVCHDHGINPNSILFEEDAIVKIIKNYTKEAGVRELERKIAMIIRKIVTKMVIDHNFKKVIKINERLIHEYLKQEIYDIHYKQSKEVVGSVQGLAYTPVGGEVLTIEANHFKGTGHLILTGSLGEVMKESAQIALDYIKANMKKYKLSNFEIQNEDIHIHVPDGAIKKDGPSAGVALVTVLLSLFLDKPVSSTVAFTGEITLQGNILPVGGLKEKIIGASRSGIKKIFLPSANKKEVESIIPSDLKETIELVFVSKYEDIWRQLGGAHERKTKISNK